LTWGEPHVQGKVLFLGKRADYYKSISEALHERKLAVAIATTADGAVAMCLTNRVILVLIDCDESWPADCWHPARAIKAVAPRVPIIALADKQTTLDFVDAYCVPDAPSVKAKVMEMVASK
jgi:DNA-binding response OmpR family regulator